MICELRQSVSSQAFQVSEGQQVRGVREASAAGAAMRRLAGVAPYGAWTCFIEPACNPLHWMAYRLQR